MNLDHQQLIVRAPPKLAGRIAGRLHIYFDVSTQPPRNGYCQIDAVIEGRPMIVCMFQESLEFGSIMTLFNLKAKQIGLTS
ncbi:MAG: hypothetical protein JRN21_10125 [Nitrososphaerota archaeon]|nr:hypothetical protein [Nitrososphaerota archaeon]